ncbi:MAG: NUDIX hydrolase [Pseudomonadales bacterium]
MLLVNADNIRLAATILLLRDSSEGPEVFMLQRPGGGDFPDLHVFPGGKVDTQDHVPDQVRGLDDPGASVQLGLAEGGLRFWAAAIRECFEECGVLLAYRGAELVRFDDPGEAARFEDYREQLIDGSLSLETLCRLEGLTLATDQVHYFSHWITPEQAPRRFDTRFFIAAMPGGQETLAHAWETAADAWVRPVQALAAHREGRWQMISPTLTTLASIESFSRVSDILQAVRREAHLPMLTDALRSQGMHDLR